MITRQEKAMERSKSRYRAGFDRIWPRPKPTLETAGLGVEVDCGNYWAMKTSSGTILAVDGMYGGVASFRER